jgi:PEP-CTERM motif
MTRFDSTVLLAAASIFGINTQSTSGEEIAINYGKIEFEYVEETDSGITFGRDSTFPSLPADFFGPGSEPFTGNIPLKGSKILQNVVLARTSGAVFSPPLAPQDIPLEMVELNLASIQPIVVNYSNGLAEQWDLTINLNRNENSSCWIRVAHNVSGEPDGGAILPVDSFFDIFAEVTFTHAPPSGAPRHRFFAIVDRTQLNTSDATWAHQHSSIAGGANREFIPGADPGDPLAPLQVLFFEGSGLDLPLRVTNVVPEPSSMTLVALGTAALIAVGFRRRSQTQAYRLTHPTIVA